MPETEKFLIFTTILLTASVGYGKHTFLREKPQELTSCRQASPNFKSCFIQAYQDIFRIWKNGVPGFKSLGSLDPLHVKRIGIIQNDNNSVLQMNLNMRNVKVKGFSQLEVLDIDFNVRKLIFTTKFLIPQVNVDFDYDVKALLNQLSINGSDKGDIKIDDFEFSFQVQHKLRHEFNQIFAELQKLELRISNISDFYANLGNLFDGQEILEADTTTSWRDLYPTFAPALKEALQTIWTNYLKKFYHYVPFNYFIEDISTNAVDDCNVN